MCACHQCQWNACHALVSLLCPTGALAARLVPPLPAPHWASDLFLSLCVAMGSVGQGDACGGAIGSTSSSGAVSPRGSAQADHKVRAYACQALAAPPTRHVYGHAFAPVLLAAVQALRYGPSLTLALTVPAPTPLPTQDVAAHRPVFTVAPLMVVSRCLVACAGRACSVPRCRCCSCTC